MNPSRPKVKISRALGIALTPKSVKYFERRPFPPGVHGRARKKPSDYSVRLREKQRLRHQYNIAEGQLRRVFARALRHPGKTGERLVIELECRLDALVLRSGIARTIYQARQMVTHGHITVDGTKVNVPSYRLRPGQTIAVRDRSRPMVPFEIAAAGAHANAAIQGHGASRREEQAAPLGAARPLSAPYLSTSLSELRTTLMREPVRTEVPVICDEQMVVEFYSR